MDKTRTGRQLQGGVGKREITTEAPEARIRDPLCAKALVLDDGRTRVAIVSMDVTAIGGRKISAGILPDVGEEFLPEVRARVERELGIPGDHVLVNASHTHPPGRMLCDDEEQVARVLAAVREAVEGLEPVTVGGGAGHEDRITLNRDLRLKSGKEWTIRHTNPCPPDEQVVGVGPIDPEIGLLRVDRLDGSPLAVVYNFACHPMYADAQGSISAGFPGVASGVIEEAWGGGAMALFLQGAGGNICDVWFKDMQRPRDMEAMGNRLGLSAVDALGGIKTGDADLNVITETIRLPRRTDIPERIAALREEQAGLLASLHGTSLNFRSFLPLYLQYELFPEYPSHYAYRYLQEEAVGSEDLRGLDALNRGNLAKYLRNVEAMERLAHIQDDIATLEKHAAINRESGEATIAAEVQGIRIGESAIITSPAELLVEVGLNLKHASPHRWTLVAAFSNGYLHYGPPVEAYDRGGYEVTECLLAPEWQALYEETACGILERL